MKVIVRQFKAPAWPYASPPEVTVQVYPVQLVTGPSSRIQLKAQPGWILEEAWIVEDDAPDTLPG